MKKLSESTLQKLRKVLSEDANYLDDKGEVLAHQAMIQDPKVLDQSGDDADGVKSPADDDTKDQTFKGDRTPDDKGVKKLDPKNVNKRMINEPKAGGK